MWLLGVSGWIPLASYRSHNILAADELRGPGMDLVFAEQNVGLEGGQRVHAALGSTEQQI